jgi:hypothetical protein
MRVLLLSGSVPGGHCTAPRAGPETTRRRRIIVSSTMGATITVDAAVSLPSRCRRLLLQRVVGVAVDDQVHAERRHQRAHRGEVTLDGA